MRSVAFLLVMFLLPLPLWSQEATYRNPVISGDFPDPTVIRAGDTYYAAGSSSEWAPPFRLYESKDLVNWTYLGALFKEMPAWTMGSYWAPELFYHHDTYYVYYTARRSNDRKSFIGVATTSDVRQGFTDHGLLVEWTNEAIDAFVIERDGRWYISWKAYGLDQGKNIEILCSELSEDGLSLKGEVFPLLRADAGGWEAGGIEGQCLVNRGDYIYMFYAGNACCGAGCNYQTGVARARSIHGPWEKYAGNPILHGGGQWRCPGHGTMVTTPGGRYFYLYHAYNAATNVYTGRQGMMDEIVWDAVTGWPSFRYGKIPSVQADAPYPGSKQQPLADFSVSFDAGGPETEWIWDASQNKPSFQIRDGRLILVGNNSPSGSFLGLRPRRDSYFMQVTLEKGASPAGIAIYGARDHVMGLSQAGNRIELWQIEKGVRSTTATEEAPQDGQIVLFLETRFGQYCQFGFFRQDGQQQFVGTCQHIGNLPQWDRPPMAGIHAEGNGTGIFKKLSIRYEN